LKVDPDDPGFQNPTKFAGPVYGHATADRIGKEKGWVFKKDDDKWRRVVASPKPKRIFEIGPIRWLLEKGVIVIAAGGGGTPTMYKPNADRQLIGVGAVIDKDLASELLARDLNADLYIMATDATAVSIGASRMQRPFTEPTRRPCKPINSLLGQWETKVDAACRFAEATGKTAAIGALADIPAIVAGEKGTLINPGVEKISWHA
jgi:carbamate kinase